MAQLWEDFDPVVVHETKGLTEQQVREELLVNHQFRVGRSSWKELGEHRYWWCWHDGILAAVTFDAQKSEHGLGAMFQTLGDDWERQIGPNHIIAMTAEGLWMPVMGVIDEPASVLTLHKSGN